MANYYTITGNVGGFLPANAAPGSYVAVLRTNLTGPVVDTSGNRVSLGDAEVPVAADGSISISALQTDATDTNVSGWSYWLEVGHRTHVSKVHGHGATRAVTTLGPFPLTQNSTLAELSVHFDTPAVDPTWRDGFRAEMEDLRDEAVAITGLTGEDGAVALLVNTPGSETEAALAASFARLTGPVDALKPGMVIAHRGGGAYVYPEHCMAGYEAAQADGFIPEADVWPLADGTPVCCHNPTADATMNITGALSSLTPAQWAAAKINPLATGLPAQPSVTLAQFLDQIATRGACTVEVKAAGAAPAIIQAITIRGLQRSVLLQATDWDTCLAAHAAGIEAAYVSDVVGTSGKTTAELAAAGIRYVVMGSTAATQARVEALAAADLRVLVYAQSQAANDPAQLANVLTWGGWGVFSDDPWSQSRHYPTRVTRELFDSPHLGPAGRASVTAHVTRTYDLAAPALVFTHATTTPADGRVQLGRLGYGSSILRLRFRHTVGASQLAAPTTTWALAVYVGNKTSGGPHTSAADENAILFNVQHNGARNIWQRVGTTQTTVSGTTAADATNFPTDGSAGTVEMEYEIEVTATTATLTNRTLNVSSTGSHTLGTLADAFITVGTRSSGATYRDFRIVR